MGLKHFLATLGALGMLVMAGAVPAQATIFDRGSFSFEESVDEDLCGIDVHRDTVFNLQFRNRTGKGDLDQAFFGFSRLDSTDTFTNLATGASFTIEGGGISKDVRATRVSGNVFEFTVLDAGMTAVVRDMDGNVVLRDRGALWRTILFDTLGDSQPGGVPLEEVVTRVSGPHPLFDMDEDAFCGMVHELIG